MKNIKLDELITNVSKFFTLILVVIFGIGLVGIFIKTTITILLK